MEQIGAQVKREPEPESEPEPEPEPEPEAIVGWMKKESTRSLLENRNQQVLAPEGTRSRFINALSLA